MKRLRRKAGNFIQVSGGTLFIMTSTRICQRACCCPLPKYLVYPLTGQSPTLFYHPLYFVGQYSRSYRVAVRWGFISPNFTFQIQFFRQPLKLSFGLLLRTAIKRTHFENFNIVFRTALYSLYYTYYSHDVSIVLGGTSSGGATHT